MRGGLGGSPRLRSFSELQRVRVVSPQLEKMEQNIEAKIGSNDSVDVEVSGGLQLQSLWIIPAAAVS